MKYIDIEKLIALIDAKLEDLGMSGSVWVGRSVLQDLKNDIITSLQQEQPEVDIEKEIDELWKSLNTGHDYVIVDSYQDFLGICLHCFELGLNARKEE